MANGRWAGRAPTRTHECEDAWSRRVATDLARHAEAIVTWGRVARAEVISIAGTRSHTASLGRRKEIIWAHTRETVTIGAILARATRRIAHLCSRRDEACSVDTILTRATVAICCCASGSRKSQLTNTGIVSRRTGSPTITRSRQNWAGSCCAIARGTYITNGARGTQRLGDNRASNVCAITKSILLTSARSIATKYPRRFSDIRASCTGPRAKVVGVARTKTNIAPKGGKLERTWARGIDSITKTMVLTWAR